MEREQRGARRTVLQSAKRSSFVGTGWQPIEQVHHPQAMRSDPLIGDYWGGRHLRSLITEEQT